MTRADPRIGRLRWRSRRGLLELDHILKPFFQGDLSRCDEATITALEHLLDAQDPDLLNWMLGRATPQDPQLESVIKRIRNTR